MADFHITPEYSTVRGLSSLTPEVPRSGEQLCDLLQRDFWDPDLGPFKKIAGTIFYLLPALLFGRIGQNLTARVVGQGGFLRKIAVEAGDEIFSAIFTSSVRLFVYGDDWTAYFRDCGQGLVARGFMNILPEGAGFSLGIRFLWMPLFMMTGSWVGEAVCEKNRELTDLIDENARWELLYRWISSYAMIGQSAGLLRGVPFLLRKGGIFCPSLHPDDWRKKDCADSPIAAELMSRKIQELLEHLPFVRPTGLAQADLEHANFIRGFVAGEAEFVRLKELYRLLLGERPPSDGLVIENGSCANPYVALQLAKLGARVVIKEPGLSFRATHRLYVRTFAPGLLDRIVYETDLNRPYKSPFVIWANVGEMTGIPDSISLSRYLVRDVAEGGYAAFQWESHYKKRVELDPARWEKLFSGNITEPLFSTSHGGLQYLEIYRRRLLPKIKPTV